MWLVAIQILAKLMNTTNCSHVGPLSRSSARKGKERGGYGLLRNAGFSQEEKFMNGTGSLWWHSCGGVCLFCVMRRSRLPLPNSKPVFLFLQVSEPPGLLSASFSWSQCLFDYNCACLMWGPWLDVSQMCCGPYEKLSKRLDCNDILALQMIRLLYRTHSRAKTYKCCVDTVHVYLSTGVLGL